MKSLITLITTIVMTLLASSLFATESSGPIRFWKVENIVDHYIDASMNGKTETVDYLFSRDFYLSTPNNRSSENVTRTAWVKYLKSLKGLVSNATTEYEFVEKNENCSIVRIVSTFSTFKRNDYVTICNSEEGWKISNVVVTYPETK